VGYDAASNIASQALTFGSADSRGTVSYGYKAADQLSSLAEPGGSCAGYSWAAPPSAAAACTVFNLDNDGRRTGTRFPSGSTVSASFDGSGRVTPRSARSARG
jgi:hypothetical protein